LFHAFDTDDSGHLNFREMFVGMALLLSSSFEQRLECAFDMMDANGSGRVSREEMASFLRYIAPPSATRYDVGMMSLKAIKEADDNRTGLVTYQEFFAWEGKQGILNWIDQYHDRVLASFDGAVVPSAAKLSPGSPPAFPEMERHMYSQVPKLNPLLPEAVPTRGGHFGNTFEPENRRALPLRVMNIYYASAEFGSRGQLEVQSNDTIDSVKAMIARAEAVPASSLRLFLKGEEIRLNTLVPEMHNTLYDFGVSPGDVLQLVYEPGVHALTSPPDEGVPGLDSAMLLKSITAIEAGEAPLSMSALGDDHIHAVRAHNQKYEDEIAQMQREIKLLELKQRQGKAQAPKPAAKNGTGSPRSRPKRR